MSENPTVAVLKQLQAGDKSALQSLFQKHYPEVCRAIYRFVSDKDQAQDLAQEVFIRLWKKRAQLEINTSFGAYLHKMAINEALSFLRKNKRQEDKISQLNTNPIPSAYSATDGEALLIEKELKDQVTAAIDALPPRCRAIFQLSRYEELSYREISEKLEISIKTVEHQMGKALKILRISLQQHLSQWAWLLLFLDL